jgi:hypothetical protein
MAYPPDVVCTRFQVAAADVVDATGSFVGL